MECASSQAFISRKVIDKYKKKRQPQQQQQQQQDQEGSDDEFSGEEVDDQEMMSNDIAQTSNQPTKQNRQAYRKQVDTNVFNLNLGVLESKANEIATGDPLFCKGCKAIFNKFSKITKQDISMIEEGKVQEENKNVEQQIIQNKQKEQWVCEYCYYKNEVQIEQEEIPKSDKVNYIIEAAPNKVLTSTQSTETQGEEQKSKALQDDITVIFCIDVSGSMSEGQRVKNNNQQKYISKLECVKNVLAEKIRKMGIENPNRKVGIVAFESTVHISGDGYKDKMQFVKSNEMNNYESMLSFGKKISSDMISHSVSESQDSLQKKLKALTPLGGTALGPGLLTSVAMAGEGSPGSIVILCTDGVSTDGLGALFGSDLQQAEFFYGQVGEYAKNKGVLVNMLFIQGAECNIQILSKVSEVTNGEVQIVTGQDLESNIGNVLNLTVIATQVQLKVKLHKGIQFRNEDEPSFLQQEDKSVLTKEIGNVTRETEVTFEYQIKSVKELLLMDDLDLEKLTELPFQAQIYYKAMNGDKCVLVISNSISISSDREKLEEKANYDIMGLNAIKQTSKFARKGDFLNAQINAKAWDKKIQKTQNSSQEQAFQNYRGNMGNMYNAISNQNQMMQPQLQMNQQQQPQNIQMSGQFNQYQQMQQPQQQQQNQMQFISPQQQLLSNNFNQQQQYQQMSGMQQMQQPQNQMVQQNDQFSQQMFGNMRLNKQQYNVQQTWNQNK